MQVNGYLDSLVGSRRLDFDASGKIYGVVPAIVKKIHDPDQQRHMGGMVQVFFPWLQPEGAQKPIMPWARVVTSGGARGVGFAAIPQIGDEVCVGFEHGDIHFPYVLGSLWNGRDSVPTPTTPGDSKDMQGQFGGPTRSTPDLGPSALSGDKGANEAEYWKSRSGNLIVMHDSPEGDTVRLNDKTGKSAIELRKDEILVMQRSGDLKFYAQQKFRIDCEDCEIYAGNNIEFTAKNNFGCKAENNIHITAGANYSATSKQKFMVASNVSVSVTAGANINIQSGSKAWLKAMSGSVVITFGGAVNFAGKADAIVSAASGAVTVTAGAMINMSANGDIKWKAGAAINGMANCINLN